MLKQIKRLKPSMREKKHYLVVASCEKKVIDDVLLEHLGVFGYAKAGIRFVSSDFVRGKIILAVNCKSVKDVKAALAIAGFRCVGVSGTIKKAREKFFNKK